MEQPTREQLDQLAEKWLKGTITPEERELLDQWYNRDTNEPLQWTGQDDSEDILGKRLLYNIQQNKKESSMRIHRKWYFSAAAIILITLTTAYFYRRQNPAEPALAIKSPVINDIAAGGNKAILILSDGKKINLSNAQNGQLAREGNVVINKTGDGKVLYEPSDASNGSIAMQYNTLITPRGGNYDLTLSDGTKVWLNAASSIKYPSAFTGNTRQVEVTGEAYFEVTHNAAKPFKVMVAGQVIEDLGTSFNINAYTDEPVIAATLLEGSIKISNSTHSEVLKPGEQAVVRHNQSISLNPDVDIEEAMAWHRGLFKFHDADIEEVMRQLSRWYDVDVSYEGNIPSRKFSGKIYRNQSALKVCDILNYKNIHFRIEGKKIVVMP